ncbi:MAG: DUF4266 domain-containing protein [candidate division Zixibacteria bacterium]|nr:DUF4266 domain-containing protein [candidate division Zixibacteria bacterium]
MKKRPLLGLILFAMIVGGGLIGCAPMRVEVWERDVLAKPEMQLDAGAIDRGLDDHIYFSKEASSGGSGFGGGGCGCN